MTSNNTQSVPIKNNKTNCLHIIKDGQQTIIDPPYSGYGECKIVWKDGKVLDVIKSERIRL